VDLYTEEDLPASEHKEAGMGSSMYKGISDKTCSHTFPTAVSRVFWLSISRGAYIDSFQRFESGLPSCIQLVDANRHAHEAFLREVLRTVGTLMWRFITLF
jgi:hypothetical protein